MDSFKEWLQQESSWTDAGIHLGNAVSTDAFDEIFDQFLNVIQTIDRVIGTTKFFKSLPHAVFAGVMVAYKTQKFLRNPTDMKALDQVIKRLTEASKMGIYSGATIPLGALAGNIVAPGFGEAAGAIIAKAISYGYFYLGQWADLNLENKNKNIASRAKKIKELMPKTIPHPETDEKPRGLLSRFIGKFHTKDL